MKALIVFLLLSSTAFAKERFVYGDKVELLWKKLRSEHVLNFCS